MDEVKEKSTSIITLTFTDEAGDPVTPSSGSYRIDDVVTDTEILGDTVFSPSSSTHDLEITSAQNAMIKDREQETHELTVEFTYSGTKKGTNSYLFSVVNLRFMT